MMKRLILPILSIACLTLSIEALAEPETSKPAAPKAKTAEAPRSEISKSEIHISVRNYTALKFECVTDRHHVQIQEMASEKLRYISWAPGATAKKPELNLPDGETMKQTSGSVIYRFKGGDFVYEVEDAATCKSCKSHLRVIRGTQVLTQQECLAR